MSKEGVVKLVFISSECNDVMAFVLDAPNLGENALGRHREARFSIISAGDQSILSQSA